MAEEAFAKMKFDSIQTARLTNIVGYEIGQKKKSNANATQALN